MKKRFVSVVLALGMLLSLVVVQAAAAPAGHTWDGVSAEGFSRGPGSRQDPYLISTPEQLAHFRDLVNDSNSSICARVVADIDLGGHEWEPIGLTKTGYAGIFDGGGWEIRNMHLSQVSDPLSVVQPSGDTLNNHRFAGLFGVVGSGGTVKYVNLSGVVSGEINTSSGAIYAGSLAGMVYGTIEECFSTCRFTELTISGNGYVGIGGLVGLSQQGSTVKNCYNVGDIDATVKVKQGKNVYVGGVMGYQMADTRNCYSTSAIDIDTSGKLCLGGVVGLNGITDKLNNCYYDRQLCSARGVAGGAYKNGNTPVNPNNCKAKWTANMKTAAFAQTLGSAFATDVNHVNNGYPVLSVMTYGEEEDWSEWYEDELEGDAIDREVYDRLLPAELMSKDLTRPITRVEFAAVAVELYEEMSGRVIAIPDETPFEDTSSDAAAKAWSVGITNGTSATTFSPYVTISRQDLATMLTRVYKSLYLSGWTLEKDSSYALDYAGVTPFQDDGDISAYAKPSVYFMVKNEIIKGVRPGYFAPRNLTSVQAAEGYADATREQAMIMAVRAFGNLQK